MQMRIAATAALCLVVAACGPNSSAPPKKQAAASEHAEVPNEAVPQAQLPRVATPTHYGVTLTVDPTKERFSGHTDIAVTFSEARRAIFIDGLDLNVTKVRAVLANGKAIEAKYAQVDPTGVARLIFDSAVPKGNATLSFDYDAPYDTSLAGLYKVVDRGDSYAFTQFENSDARRAFPSFDEPGFKAPFDITVISPAANRVVGNAPIASTATAGHGMTKTVFQQTKPLPTYLVALAIGPLDIVDAGVVPPNKYRKNPIPVRGVTARGNGARIKYAMSLTPSIITALENYYGVAYPFQKLDVLAVPDFAAGAMENAGAITYRERYLFDAEQSEEQRRNSLEVQAHELAHQWFGDLVTPAWWDDIWLNESFANWMETKASGVVHPNGDFGRERLDSAVDVMHLDEAASARQIHQPVKNADDVDNAFDSITYDKGSAVLAMFENYVGERDWQKGVHAYLTKFAFKNATAQDFIGTIAKTTNHPEIVDAFNSYIDQPGIPELGITYGCDAKQETASVTQAMYTQIGRAAPTPARIWDVPMCTEVAGKKACQLVGASPVTVNFKAVCTAQVMPNAEGKGYYRFSLAGADLDALIKASPKMSAANQLTLFANVEAGMREGKAIPTQYFNTIHALAPVAQWDLLSQMRDVSRRFRGQLLGADDLGAYRSFMAAQFGARMKAVGFAEKKGEAAATSLAREFLADLIVSEAHDQATIDALAKAVQPYVASGGTNLNGIAPDVLPAAMEAGVIAGGAPFADQLISAVQSSTSEAFRRNAINALSGSEDPAVLNKVIQLSGTMRIGEIRYLYQYMQEEPVARAALWTFVKTNFAAIEKRVSSQGFGRAPGLLQYACDNATKKDLHSFFASKTKDLEGTARTLAQAEEKIGYCVAFKDAKGRDFTAALRASAMPASAAPL